MKKIIYTERAPRPIGPYSQGIVAGCYVFISGQIPIDPLTGKIVDGEFSDRVVRVLENIKAIIESVGGSLNDIVKVTVFLRDIGMFQQFNEIYSRYFKEDPPARTVVEVSNLPRGVDIEMEAIAYICRE
ncbi:endoribonuclease L-PSP [Ignisphaera aggregans DSM 17230]|uniref:Endoribonuclease L-PSP n=1 Tax=Ignisphaera aggregans (strain DSM 17230 / JCM 13409 / AQ1.S1) TaxID=583356 RepID=E0STF7_IGNAA|nr:endoribonuclease L-PSP [Ignisphaera aggregans DSM 17230]